MDIIDINEIRMMFGTGASSAKKYEELYPLIDTAIKSGVRSFDSAPSYGTEQVLSKIFTSIFEQYGLKREDIFIQTKIDPIQMQNGCIEEYFIKLLNSMGLEFIDSLLIHWPVAEYFEETWNELIKLKEKQSVRYIGICNLRMRHLNKLEKYIVKPDIIQIERHPLRTCREEMHFCQKNGIVLQAYSPLCKFVPQIRDSIILKRIAEKYGLNIGQLVLIWHLNTGDVPIFTSKKASRIMEYASIESLKLTAEEINIISSLNLDYKLYLESLICSGF